MITAVSLGSTLLTDGISRFCTAVRNLTFPLFASTPSPRGSFAGQKIALGKPTSYKFALEWLVLGADIPGLATARENFQKILAVVLTQGAQTLKITKSNGVQVQIDIKTVNLTGDISADTPQATAMVMECETEYPYLMSQTLSGVTANIFQGGGMAIPMGIPMSMGNGGANELVVASNGTVDAFPTFTFTGPLANPTLTNLTTGKVLNINTTLNSGQSLTVDTYNRTVLLNGVTNYRQYVSGDFWTLTQGNNVVHLSAAVYNAVGNCLINYRDHYIGL
jgi:hypothetical protein